MSVRKHEQIAELAEEIEYPEADGQPLAETDTHRDLLFALIAALQSHFASDSNVYVSGNLLLYYIEDDPTKSLSPDVFVVRGVANHERRIYKLWEEGRAPNVVIEVSSRKTKKEDLGWKKQLYAWLGVAEYFIFDPEYKLKPPLCAFRLRGKEFVEEAVTGQRVLSAELGLELVNTGKTLRLLDPATGQFLPTPREEAAARRQAEAHVAAVEAELERLRAELAQLKRKPAKKRAK